ncbi:MAG: glucose-1-phosphate thymidylyltransferase [Candidatus Marinimicrobia bacterium]|nr:glucose-1-phosphate thymidylyltransferase [Candidatus Neomarinimicrobiota bacterium]|tara:strand:- start:4088 stop:4951 length:864 start_codon:yes stop_codon:yes gene_type:complete
MKGIVLAGGAGTRLFPSTKIVTKQLLPIYNKPMIYYPLSTLMLSGIQDVLIISTPRDISKYEELLGDGKFFGIKISYQVQKEPKGIAEAFLLGQEFIGDDDVCLILGDNVFYGNNLPQILKNTLKNVEENNYSMIFGYQVKDPERYGVIEFNSNKEVISIEEKPSQPKSNYAAVGLYFYKNDVVQIAKGLSPSSRGELEITDVNSRFLLDDRLKVEIFDSIFWLDTGTHDALVEASNFIKTIEKREGKKISCLEEIAYKYGYISKSELQEIIIQYSNDYGNYLKKLL